MTEPLMLSNGRVWTGTSEDVAVPGGVVIEDGLITDVGPHVVPHDAWQGTVVDVEGCTVIPGLCDLHVHLTTNSREDHVVDNSLYRALVPGPAKLLHGVRHAVRALKSGFTTLRIMGHREAGDVALRDFINDGLLPGPRLLVAPWVISMTGGRGDLFYPPTLQRQEYDTADGVDECRKVVRLQRKAGADFIKVTASGGMLSGGDKPHWPNYSVPELRAIVEESHDYDLRVAAHAHSPIGIKRALAAGVDTIEHGSFIDDEAIGLMVDQGSFLVPTLALGHWLASQGRERGAPSEGLQKLEVAMETHVAGLRRAVEAGVRIAMGTDSTGTMCPVGEHALELELYVEVAGMTPTQALRAATMTAAEAMDLEAEIGSLETGKRADVVVVRGDPTVDITSLRRPGAIHSVYRDGREVLAGLSALV